MRPASTDLAAALRQRRTARFSLGLTVVQMFALGLLGVALVPLWHRVAGLTPGSTPHVIAVLSTVIAVVLLPHVVVRRMRRRWIETVELPLDRTSYLDALNGESYTGALEVELHGATEPPDVSRLPGTRVATHADRVSIVSPVRKTRTTGKGIYVYNLPLHRWFRELSDGVLVPYLRAHAIETIVVRHVAADKQA